MLPIIINPLSILISFSVMFGVFVHDTQICNVASVVAAMPVEIISTNINEVGLLKTEKHIHLPSGSFSIGNDGQQTAIQPRNENEKKYIAQRRRIGNTFDNGYSWPST